jgi:hypothetical protein
MMKPQNRPLFVNNFGGRIQRCTLSLGCQKLSVHSAKCVKYAGLSKALNVLRVILDHNNSHLPLLMSNHMITSYEVRGNCLHYQSSSEFVFLCSVRRLLVTANVVPSSPILVTLMKEALNSPETSVLTRAIRRNIPGDAIVYFMSICSIPQVIILIISIT